MRVAICDDDAHMLGELRSFCQKMLDKEDAVCVFNDTFKLENAMSDGENYDLLLLDIEMPERSGLEFKNWMEAHGITTDIVYLTFHEEVIKQAFGRNVIGFLDKEDYKASLENILLKEKEKLAELLEFFSQGMWWKLEAKYVWYIQAADKYSEIHCKLPGEAQLHCLLTNVTMRDWEKTLPQLQFYRVSRKLILNFEYVKTEKIIL